MPQPTPVSRCLKRWDLVAFFALAIAPLVALTVIFCVRALRIAPLAAQLPGRFERRLAPMLRPAHAPGEGRFDAATFADLAALDHKLSVGAGDRLRKSFEDGVPPPAEFIALASEEKTRVERILRASRAPVVDPPIRWILSISSARPPQRDDLNVLAFARLAATLALMTTAPSDAVDVCVDATAVARDLSYGSGILGVATRKAVVNTLALPCSRILTGAPAIVRARAHEALERIEAAIPPWREVIEDEGLNTELIVVGSAFPEGWRQRLPVEAQQLLEEAKRLDPQPLWNRAFRLDAWPDIHAATQDLVAALPADPAGRKAAYRREMDNLKRSPNPLAFVSALDLGKWDDVNEAAHAPLGRLIAAAR